MKRLAVGILAHVDSGKTTLSEALLYHAGEIRKLGRVDHKDAFLDNNSIERERGITIFSHQATLKFADAGISLLDTPGHVDFSAEMERTLRVLDYAILVISAADGVQSHTETLWNLLRLYGIPTFIFVNKMDIKMAEKDELLAELTKKLGEGCLDFSALDDGFFENAAMLSESLFEEFEECGKIGADSLKSAILERKIFPCFFGSALKDSGVSEFLRGFLDYTEKKPEIGEFGAKVFKISEDERGNRLTHMKITGGILKVKDIISGTEKVNEIRVYSGEKYKNEQEVCQGDVCAVTGLSKSYPGQGLGFEPDSESLVSEPLFTYSVRLPDDIDAHTALGIFKKLEEEETQMHALWNEHLQRIDVEIMGEIQLEVLKRILSERFGLSVEFESGSIIYKETIKNTVEGVGHYEPLRHYAEVHLLLEPGKPGSGVQIKVDCSEDVLDKNWQRLIVTHLAEKEHIGVLTGSPITDIVITLIAGRAHLKHTEGGDFRQATYRAVRQGLMQAQSVLLEPWFSFKMEVPIEQTGRAMTDLSEMGAEFESPVADTEVSIISGSVPVIKMNGYQKTLISYTHGRGRLACTFKGYFPCTDADTIIEKIGYNPESDVANTPDSVFCAHGSGYNVKWHDVFSHMHIEARKEKTEEVILTQPKYRPIIADEEELLRIFEQTYGKVKRKELRPMRTQKEVEVKFKAKPRYISNTEYLLIDGYNIIFAWDELRAIAEESLDDARILLIDKVCNYQAMRENNVILVFDAYRVKGARREVEKAHGISVVYTREAETADAYIEKTSHELSKHYKVRVATSDNLEQIIIFGQGAIRVPASEFAEEVRLAEEEMREFIRNNN